jgi:4-amino-4-deoxy-L-arabinose transferase-like glycosyltransferase
MLPVNIGIRLSLIIILVVGGFLRFYGLGDQSLWIDEGYSINAAQSVLEKGLPIMDSGEWYKKGQADVYSIAASLTFFDFDAFNPWPARLPAAIFGTLSILMAGIFAGRLCKSYAVILGSSLLMALSTWEIAWSRQARGYAGMQFFLILSLYLLVGWFQERKRGHLFGGLFCFAISALSHPSALVVLLPLGIIFIVDALKRSGWRNLKTVLVSGGAVVVGAIGFFFLAPSSSDFDFVPYHLAYLSTTYPLFICCALGALVWSFFSHKDRVKVQSLALIIVVPILFLSFYQRGIDRRYLLTIFPFILILAVFFLEKVASRLGIRKEAFVPVAVLVALCGIGYGNLTYIPQSLYTLERGSPQPDFKSGYEYILQHKGPDDVIVSPYAHLSKIYTGNEGLWLAIELSGTKDVEEAVMRGTDYYTNAPTVATIDDIKNVMTSLSGYVIIDTHAYVRLGNEKMRTIIDNQKATVYTSGDVRLKTSLIIYKF